MQDGQEVLDYLAAGQSADLAIVDIMMPKVDGFALLEPLNKAGIPVFGSEVEQVKAGCVASMGLEYIELGKQTGKMAAKVLKGEAKASELNFEVISEPSLYVNFAAAEKIGLELPENYKTDAYQSFDEIVVQ